MANKTSAAQLAAAARWQAANVDVIRIKPHKRDMLRERIAQAVDAGRAKSQQDYIITAVKDKLEKDGF